MGYLRVTIGYLRATMGHLKLNIGYLKATPSSMSGEYIYLSLIHI